MATQQTVYILGAGAIGFPLAAALAGAGREVLAVRTSRDDVPRGTLTITTDDGEQRRAAQVETISLSQLAHLEGLIVVASKAYANPALARQLRARQARGPIVIMQNGVGVEQPFLDDAQFTAVYRCILYVTSQVAPDGSFRVRPVAPSPIGVLRGDPADLAACVAALDSPRMPFRAEPNIQREIWKKAIINVAFNSICPLLDSDNGVFARSPAAAALARDIVGECVALTERLSLGLGADELMEQILLISRRSDGQLISTLQDIRAGRPTEIESLNLAIAQIAAALRPPLELPRVELLGRMIVAKSLPRAWAGGGEPIPPGR